MPTQNRINDGLPFDVSSGGTGQNSLDAYKLLAAGTSSTGPLQTVSLGTSGQILKSNGAGSLPSFQNDTNWVLYKSATVTAGDAQVLFTDIDTTYRYYQFVLDRFTPTNNNVAVYAQVSTNNGVSFLNTNYTSSSSFQSWNSTTVSGLTSSTTFYRFSGGVGNNSAFGFPLVAWGFNFGTATPTALRGLHMGNVTIYVCGGTQNSTSTVNSIRFYVASGTLKSGSIRVYGLKS